MIELDISRRIGNFSLHAAFQAENEVLALLGASGSGKSMTLRCIAGVETPDSGRIVVNGTVFFDSEKRINLTPQQRKVGMLFQNYALFPNMTVLQNIMTGVRGGTKKEKRDAAMETAERFQILGLEDRFPAQLSGGQQQRVALARILVGKPRILMLDEPFSALDSHLRDQLEREVMGITRGYEGTTLLVSHSRDEVFRMSDRVAVFYNGQVEAVDEKHRVFQNPGTYHAALLTGCKNFSRVSGLRHESGQTLFYADDWGMELRTDGTAVGDVVAVRGHYIRQTEADGPNTFDMAVTGMLEDPFENVLQLARPGFEENPIQWMIAKADGRILPEKTVRIHIAPQDLMLLRQ